MRAALLTALLTLSGTIAAPPAGAAEGGFDNPTLGNAPCMVLNRYEVSRSGADQLIFAAQVDVENICGRSLEAMICVSLAEPVDGEGRVCRESVLRPWSETSVAFSGTPARITGPDYRWRYLPVR